MYQLTKVQVIDRVTDVLSGGDLDVLNSATTDFDIPSATVVPVQSYLQGFIFAAKNLAGLTDEDINNIDISFEKSRVLSNIDLIEHVYE